MKSFLKLLEYLFGWLFLSNKKSFIIDRKDYEKIQKENDHMKKIIKDALDTGNLDELRKKISE